MEARPLRSGFCFVATVLLLGACGAKKLDVPDEKPTGPPPICAVESPELCLQDGVDLYHGLNREADPEAAQSKFELACAGGEPRGCTYLGMMLTASENGMDVRRGLGLLDEACQADVVMACAEMGAQLMGRAWMQTEADGEPATAAFAEANRRLRKACEMVETPAAREFWGRTAKGYACSNLGSAFEHGFGVEKDLELAFDLHRRACGLGFEPGCEQVAYFVDEGLVDVDSLDE